MFTVDIKQQYNQYNLESMTLFCISTIRCFILRCKIDQRSATQIGDAVNKYHRQNCPGTHDFDEVMRTADFERFFLVHHQLKFSSVLALNFRVHTQYAALSTPLVCYTAVVPVLDKHVSDEQLMSIRNLKE